MKLRPYRTEDDEQLFRLFYETVHSVNAKDYDTEQRKAWAPAEVDIEEWCASFAEHYTLVAEEEGCIVGFGDIDDTGYLDRLFTHRDYQGKGIAAHIADALEGYAAEQGISAVTAFVSITARPFFTKRGYELVRENKVARGEIVLINYEMRKVL